MGCSNIKSTSLVTHLRLDTLYFPALCEHRTPSAFLWAGYPFFYGHFYYLSRSNNDLRMERASMTVVSALNRVTAGLVYYSKHAFFPSSLHLRELLLPASIAAIFLFFAKSLLLSRLVIDDIRLGITS